MARDRGRRNSASPSSATSSRLTSWECDVAKDCAISVAEDGGSKKNVEVIAYYPFCGSTRGKGPVPAASCTSRAATRSRTRARRSRRNRIPRCWRETIVVIDMPLAKPAGSDYSRIRWYPGRFPATRRDQEIRPNPANQGGRAQMELFEDKVQALVLCTNDVSNDTGRYSYLPFSDQHEGSVPVRWRGRQQVPAIVSGKRDFTLRCDATLTPNARADSLAGTMKGKTDEVIFLTTHTDGPNEVNDNGALGVLALASTGRGCRRRSASAHALPQPADRPLRGRRDWRQGHRLRPRAPAQARSWRSPRTS